MDLAGLGRTVRHGDHAVPEPPPPPCLPRGSALDVRRWLRTGGGVPWLLVTAPRKAGIAAERNRFRRRVRMAFLELLRTEGPLRDGFTLWVRPARGTRCGHPLGYSAILSQLRQAIGPASKVGR